MDLSTERAKNDPEAFGMIFDMYHKRILGYAIRKTGNVSIAEDITAETFMKSLKALPGFRWCNISIEAWLYKIATNEINMYWRKNHACLSLDELYDQHGFETADEHDLVGEAELAQEKAERHEKFICIQETIEHLPAKYREVLILRFIYHKKIGEIAQILNKREGTVKSLVSRGLVLLRKTLKP